MATEIELFESTDLTKVRFLFVWLDGQPSLQKQGGIQQTNCSLAFFDAAASIKKREDQLKDEQHVMFAQKLQSALRLTVGFSNCNKFVISV
jgi:hypothetical protein